MKPSIEKIKNEVAVNRGYDNYLDLLKRVNNGIPIQDFVRIENEAMQEYAKQMCDEQIELCAEDLPIDTPKLAIDCVLHTPNVVTTK